MYSFLVYAAKNKHKEFRCFDKALEITKSLIPSLGCTIKASQRNIPQINGGWFYLYPEEIPDNKFITEYTDDQLAVIVFGKMVRPSGSTAAEIVANTWKTGRADAVRNLDGIFGAVIIDLPDKSIHILSDILGLRTLTWCDTTEYLIISPHDLTIVATGLCPIEYDITSAASVVACDWSLGGKPLLKNLTLADPNTHTVWKDGNLNINHKPMIIQEDRIQPNDKKAIESNIDRMIEKMQADVKHLTADAQEVTVELTAGMDSRTITAILLSVLDSSQICAFTSGSPGHYEVKAANRISRLYALKQKGFTPGPKAVDSLLPFSRLLAFISNGTTNSKRTTFTLPKPLKKKPTTFIGTAGEIYRDALIYSPLRKPPLSKFTTNDLVRHLERKLPRIRQLLWSDLDTADSIASRLTSSIEHLQKISSDPRDTLNLFYLYERYCRWGSASARSIFTSNRYSLFQSPALAALGYRLPAPISQNCLLHRTIIKRYMPKAYHQLLNTTKYMPLYPYPRLARIFEEAMKRINKAATAIQNQLPSSKSKRAPWEITGDFFATHHADTIRDMTLSQNSLSRKILDNDQLNTLLDQHMNGTQNNIQTIGFLITLEQYDQLIKQAANMANNGP